MDLTPLEAGSNLTVGDDFPNGNGTAKIVDIINIDGQNYAISSSGENIDTYQYDSNKKIITHTHSNRFIRGAETYSYEYAPNKLTEKFVHEGWPSETRTYSYDLNEYGLIPKMGVTYNDEGYTINDHGSKITILNGNAIKSEYLSATSFAEFDLTKSNIPNPLPFFGKTDHNLIQKNTIDYGGYYPYKLIVEYRYQFDNEGKVTRLITISRYYDGHKNIAARSYKYGCN
ncbi:hypothetical protein GCM10028804_04830 [Larkinella terrae]